MGPNNSRACLMQRRPRGSSSGPAPHRCAAVRGRWSLIRLAAPGLHAAQAAGRRAAQRALQGKGLPVCRNYLGRACAGPEHNTSQYERHGRIHGQQRCCASGSGFVGTPLLLADHKPA